MRTKTVALAAVLLLAATPAFTATERSHGATVSIAASAQEQAAAEQFWTRERIAGAKAFPMPIDRGTPQADLSALAPTGKPGSTPPGFADRDADFDAQSAYWRDWQAIDEEVPSAVSGTSGVYTYYDVNTKSALWQVYPHKWVGRLTFKTPTGSSAFCSATVVSGNNIVTAAHCLYDTSTNKWNNTWVFTPAYRNGSAPYGTFAYQTCWVLTAYVDLSGSYSISGWARHDVGICKLKNNSAGKSINTAVGWAGRSWNQANTQLVFNSGYPARSYTDALLPSSGAYLRSCTAETALYTTETLRSGCYYGRGISGGSWLRVFKSLEVAGNYVNSVNSGLFIGQQNLYGARFNSSNIVPLCTSAGC